MRSRHHIVGSEAGHDRPLAYMRRGHTRRGGRRGAGPLFYILLVPALVVIGIFVWRMLS